MKLSLTRKLSLVTSVADKIDRNLFERYGDVQAFGVNEAVNDKPSWHQVGSEKNKIAAAANNYAPLYGFYVLNYVVDLNGRLVAVNDKDPTGKTIDTTALYQKISRTRIGFARVSRARS